VSQFLRGAPFGNFVPRTVVTWATAGSTRCAPSNATGRRPGRNWPVGWAGSGYGTSRADTSCRWREGLIVRRGDTNCVPGDYEKRAEAVLRKSYSTLQQRVACGWSPAEERYVYEVREQTDT
jgi:hypothetical protein